MANKLSQNKISQMFKAFCEKQNNHYVSKKCRVNRNTVRKYRKFYNWDERIKEVNKKAQAEQDEEIAERLAKNIESVSKINDRFAKVMSSFDPENPSAADLDKLIRLEMYLRGMADSRPEIKTNSEFKGMSTGQLLELRDKLADGESNNKE